NTAIITITRTGSPTAVNDSSTTISNQAVTLNIGTNDITVNGGITAFDLDPTTATIDADVTNNSGHFLVDSNGNLRFIPAQNFQGVATLPYKIIDQVGETATANINILVTDQKPIAQNDTINSISNQGLTYNIGNNDSDPDGTISKFDLDPGLTGIQNSVTTPAGTFSVDNSGQLVFTPASNFQGTANLPYQAIDNTGETSNIATISINVGNRPPITNDYSTSTLSNQTVTLNIGANNSDPDGSITGFDLDPNTTGVQSSLTTIQGTYSVNNQGELVFTPSSNFQGTVNLPYQVIDNGGATANAKVQIIVGDRPPVATDDSTNTLSNTAVTLNIGVNDSDPDGSIVGFDLDVTTAQVETNQQTTQGNFQVNNQGELIFTPAQNFQGLATLPYAVVDNSGATATANISITVGNQPPVATNELRNAISNTQVTFNIGINDSDPDGSITAFDLDAITAGVQNNITTPQGIYNVSNNGQLIFTPASNFQGTANLPYTIIDNTGATATATITTIVSNQLPIANDYSTNTLSNQTVSLNIGVNDSDPDGSITGFDLDPNTTGIQSNLTTPEGTYSVNNQGELIFTPANNFKGTAILPYQAIDNSGDSANAYVSIVVENQPPVANNDTTTTFSNQPVQLNIGQNDSDSDGGTITAFDLDTKKKGIQTNRVTPDGTYSIDNNGELVFTPVNTFKGTAILPYQIFDNDGASDQANINIIVKNQPPVATDDTLKIKSNTVGIINLGANDSDIDGNITAFDLDVKKKGIQTNQVTTDGTYTVDKNGQLIFNPAVNFQGTANLAYQVFDNDGALDKANIRITVEDQPPVAQDDLGFAGQNKPGTVNILANDYDLDGSITGIDLDTKKAGIQNQATTAQGQFSVNANGNVTFTPVSGFVGTANLPYQIFDNSGETAGAKISMIVADQLPIAVDDLTVTGQNQPVTINVLANDLDLDGNITAADLDPNTAGVQRQITTTDGRYVLDSQGNVTFTPVAGFTGTASIPYQIFDNNGETAIAVLSIVVGDQPPVATDDFANTRPSKAVSLNILSNDYDPDGTITGVDLNPSQAGIQRQRTTAQGSFSVDNSGNLTFTPVPGFLGRASIPYQIFDNSGVSAGANIIVTVEDQPPVATDDFAVTNQNIPVTLSNILSNDYDLDGSITGVDLNPKKSGLQNRIIKPEGTFSIDSNSNLAFTPVSGFLGVATLPYQIFDNDGLSAKANIFIGVGDQPPIARDDLALTEKNQAVTFNVLSNDYDFDGNITGVDLNPGQGGVQTQRSTDQGIFSVGANGNVVFTPVSGFVGTASIPYQIFDNNGETATANMFVVVQEPNVINQPPIAVNDNSSTSQNQKVTFNILTNDTDIDGSITGIDINPNATGVQTSFSNKQGIFSVDQNG
ncbi:MAG: beta strand repeat-containing protein, partial [Microcoleaceae cyanobacterium]